MTAWGDMRKRSSGEDVRTEEFSQIYYDNGTAKKPVVTLSEKEYKGYKYEITTDGDYPVLNIRKNNEISIFSGYQKVVLNFPEGIEQQWFDSKQILFRQYELERKVVNSGKDVVFFYHFNQDGDYNHNSEYKRCTQEGHKYTIKEIEKYAEMFIDKIIECEDEKFKHTD